MIIKLIKFITVGFSGLIIDFSITYICKEKVLINKYLSNSLGFTIAATSNYFLNRIWTFKSENPEILTELSTFFIISIVGLFINNSMLWVLNNNFRINFYLAKLGAIIITTFWNFFANYYLTFAI
tara:strand:- start:534 stop:908 length:375 start_codon:yes stop_codon:yes gene_type:complete